MRWWAGLGGLTAAGVIGLIAASRAQTAGGESTGILLAVLSAVAGFLLIKELFDDGRDRFFPSFELEDAASRFALGVILGVLAVAGLLAAALAGGALYTTGIAVAVVSTLAVFWTLKVHFDAQAKEDG